MKCWLIVQLRAEREPAPHAFRKNAAIFGLCIDFPLTEELASKLHLHDLRFWRTAFVASGSRKLEETKIYAQIKKRRNKNAKA